MATAFMAAAASASGAHAQGATTGAVTGVVTGPNGQPVENAQVQVVNRQTGFTAGQLTRANGRFFVQNLEVGSQYAVTVRLIGYTPQTRENVVVSLNQATRADFQLQNQAAQLSAVTVTANAAVDALFNPTRQGAQTVITDTLLRRLPNLDRDFTSFVRLTPQVTSQTGGFSAAGSNPRLSQITVDGANQSDRFALNSSGGVPGGAAAGRIVPLDAIKEVQVNLTPTDVRLGNFAGVLVNAVTRSGTNTFTGGLTYTFRNPSLARDTAYVRTGNLRQQQIGGFLGGPIIKDRLHFFTALEVQRRDEPSTGASFGANAAAGDTVTGGGGITYGQIQRAQSIAQGLGIDAGTASVVKRETPLTNFIGRLDFRLNDNTRFVLRQLYNTAEQLDFSRNQTNFNADPNVQGTGFRLGSNQIPRENTNYSTVFQAFTNLPRGISNEFTASYNTIRDERVPPVATPEISVSARAPGTTGAATPQITFGTEQFSTVNLLDQKVLELTNNLTMPVGDHTLTFGVRYDDTRILNDFRQRSYGVYKFSSLDSLQNRQPVGYSVAYANGPGIAADFGAQVFSAYAQDQWAVTPRFTVSGGLRMDVPRLTDTPPENPNISAGFAAKGIQVSTTGTPKTRALFSPRLGMNWDVKGDQTLQLRGNAGVYTGNPPYILLGNAYQNTGRGLAILNCTGAATPAFTTDVNALPTSCRNLPAPVQGAAGTAGVNLTDPDFKYPQRFVTTAGADFRLPGAVTFSLEGLYGRDINGIRVTDLNITGPRLVGGQPYTTNTGRVLYADTIRTTQTTGNTPITDACLAAATCTTRAIVTNGTPAVQLGEGAIYVTNQSKGYNWSLTPRLQKRFSGGLDLTASYTYTRAYEVQSFTSDRAISIWRNGREYAGLEKSDDLTTSAYELRHRFQLFGTYTAPWKRFPTDVSADLTLNSGSPISYTVFGDLNGDGFNANDPIYVPNNATDASEIRIGRLVNNQFQLDAAAAQRFENFISQIECLDEQRGKIFERNSCFNPWQRLMNVSVRQTLPEFRGNRLSAQLDIFNFLNLLNGDWGINRGTILSTFPQQQILTVRGRTAGANSNEKGTVNYEFDSRVSDANGNAQQFQNFVNSVGNVYRMQLTFRYAF
ncbi:TonB-dependent receptor [Roseisolibacter sp. H3M3-2]|uniref:TonB-dependent receptor n=1 Tax=Roseisolibacter sp. H3M3-2 TaxID=3031323 RepID=UPI0023DC8F0D|nr:TonB-dependent receptor [Roseisolibacter sp. H3M3-2]